MKKLILNGYFCTVLTAVLFFMSGCDEQPAQQSGTLEGIITIGPICPVEKIPADPACLPTAETYSAYPVSVVTSDGKRIIADIHPALNGSFRTDLAPGNYQVLLERDLNIGGSNLPTGVSIISGEITVLNITIDTGIR